MNLLEVSDITSGYEGVQILWGVNLRLEKGKLTTLVGSNGVGKTTLLKTVMGLLRPWQGTVTFAGRDVTGLSAHARAKAGMVLVPEGRQLFTEMTVLENLEMGAFSSPGPGDLQGKSGEGLRTLSPAQGAGQAEGRHPERRRTADGGGVPGPDGRAGRS